MFESVFRSPVTVFNRVNGRWRANVINGAALTKKSTMENGVLRISGRVWISSASSVSPRTYVEDSDWELLTEDEKESCYSLIAGRDLICEGIHPDYADDPLAHRGCAPIQSAEVSLPAGKPFISVEY